MFACTNDRSYILDLVITRSVSFLYSSAAHDLTLAPLWLVL